MADFLTTAVRTGDPGNNYIIYYNLLLILLNKNKDSGMSGISLILIDTDLPGVKIRKMET